MISVLCTLFGLLKLGDQFNLMMRNVEKLDFPFGHLMRVAVEL